MFTNYIGYVTVKNLNYVKITSVNILYLLIYKTSGYIEESSGYRYLTLVPTNESKDTLEKYKEMWSKIRDPIRSITNISDDYDEKYMKLKFNSDDDLHLDKTLEVYNTVRVVKSVFHECLFKL